MVLSENHDWDLIATGFSLGLLHVLAGPDHLSALAALSVGTSYKAFMLGFRWGIGHSTGLIVVAIIFISLKGDLDLRKLGRYCDLLVGIFMIGLGSYGVIAAVRAYREKSKKRDGDLKEFKHQTIPLMSLRSSSNGNLSSLESGSDTGSVNSNGSSSGSSASSNKSSPDTIKERKKTTFIDAIFSHHEHPHVHQNTDGSYDLEEEEVVVEECPWCPFIDMHDPNTHLLVMSTTVAISS